MRECACLHCTLSAEDAESTFTLFCIEEDRECMQEKDERRQSILQPLELENQRKEVCQEDLDGSNDVAHEYDDGRLPYAAPTMHFYPNGENGVMGVILPAPYGYYDDIAIPFEEE